MSGDAQFDLHPDAESLNAFAEQALAGDERERMVAHLAACGRCRDVVFLAQEGNVEPALVAAPAPRLAEREAWFKSRRLLWVPVGALAAGITLAYVLHVRRAEPTVQTARVVNEVAPAVSAPLPAPAFAAKRSEESAVAEKKAAPALTRQRQVVATAEAAAPPRSGNLPVSAKENELQINADIAAELKMAPERADTEGAQDRMVGAAGRPMVQAEAASAPMQMKAANSRTGASQAVYQAKQLSGLPSGLVMVSTVIAEHKVLAVDKAGSVFLSADAGVHWESIGRQWSGRAVAVRSQAEVKPSADRGAPENTFELVNEEGQVWTSPDGRSWKAK
jgi:hypothetical protein